MWKVTMVLILGAVYGGFIWCLLLAMKAEGKKA